MSRRKKEIKFMYEYGLSFEEILNLGYFYFDVIQQLYYLYTETGDSFYKEEYLKHCWCESFDDSSYLIIGDTHMGSKSERKDYLDQALNAAKERNIKTVLHGGDLGDGMIDPSSKYNQLHKQISHMIEDFPKIDDMDYYIATGNHDKKYRQQGYNFEDTLEKKREDIHIVGKNIGFVKVHSHLISLEHGTTNLAYYSNWHPTPEMRFIAHEHRLSIKKQITMIPALCQNDVADFKDIGKPYRPGYLILNIESMTNYDIFGVEGYQFVKDKAVKVKERSFYLKKK